MIRLRFHTQTHTVYEYWHWNQITTANRFRLIESIASEFAHRKINFIRETSEHIERSTSIATNIHYIHMSVWCSSRTHSTEICKLRPNYKLINVLRMTWSKTTWFFWFFSLSAALEGKQSCTFSSKHTLWMRSNDTTRNWAWS